MSNKGKEAAAKKFEEYYAKFPDWYWKRGLHDAVIISVSELELVPDWKEKHPKRNCLEILLDSKNALFETNIIRISLYNYRIMDMKMNVADVQFQLILVWVVLALIGTCLTSIVISAVKKLTSFMRMSYVLIA